MPVRSADVAPTQAPTRVDNPAATGFSAGGQGCATQLAIRETKDVHYTCIVLLVPVSAPRYLLIPQLPSSSSSGGGSGTGSAACELSVSLLAIFWSASGAHRPSGITHYLIT